LRDELFAPFIITALINKQADLVTLIGNATIAAAAAAAARRGGEKRREKGKRKSDTSEIAGLANCMHWALDRSQWRQSKFILRGRIFSLTWRESGGGVLREGAEGSEPPRFAAPSPTS